MSLFVFRSGFSVTLTWMELNFLWIIWTILSISLGVMGRVRDCSRSRFITCVVNSVQAWSYFSNS